MANMKTLTVNGVTYTIDDPDAVSYGAQALTEEQRKQARENINAVSLEQLDAAVKDTVDKTCPFFSESGPVVICEPVEGYPLTVTATQEDKNYLDDYGTAIKIMLEEIPYALNLTPGNYRIRAEEVDEDSADCDTWLALSRSSDGGASWVVHELVYDYNSNVHQEVSFTVTGDADEKWAIEGGLFVGAIRSIVLNKDASQITRCGRNLLNKTAQSATLYGITFTVHDDGSITVSGTATEDAYVKVGESTLIAGVKYTLSGCPSGGSTTAYTLYIAGSAWFDFGNTVSFVGDGSAYTAWIKIGSGYHASDLLFQPMIRLAGTGGGYEPCAAETFAPGETVPALPGVNTVFADAGPVTVTGRANPAPIINDLQTRLAAIEAAIVNNTENT